MDKESEAQLTSWPSQVLPTKLVLEMNGDRRALQPQSNVRWCCGRFRIEALCWLGLHCLQCECVSVFCLLFHFSFLLLFADLGALPVLLQPSGWF